MGLNRDFKDVSTLAGIPVTRVPIVRVRLYYIEIRHLVTVSKTKMYLRVGVGVGVGVTRENGKKLSGIRCAITSMIIYTVITI